MADHVPRVGVIIVNYNSSSYLESLLCSLAAEPVERILIWDNHSDAEDSRSAQAHTERDPRCRFVDSESNVGFGEAVNRAADALLAEGWCDYLWVLNPDVVVREGSLALLLKSAREHDCAMVLPLILSTRSGLVWYSGGRIDVRAGRSIHDRIGCSPGAKDVGFDEVSFVSGAAPLIRTDDWLELRGFDGSLFLYCEDADLSLRMAARGKRMGVERRAVVEHAEGGSSTGGHGPGSVFYYYVQRNRLRVYGRSVAVRSLLIGPGTMETLRLLLNPLRGSSPGRRQRFLASAAGLRDGLRGLQGVR